MPLAGVKLGQRGQAVRKNAFLVYFNACGVWRDAVTVDNLEKPQAQNPLNGITQTGKLTVGQLSCLGIQTAETAQDAGGQMDGQGAVTRGQLRETLVVMPGVFEPFATLHRTEYQVVCNGTRVA